MTQRKNQIIMGGIFFIILTSFVSLNAQWVKGYGSDVGDIGSITEVANSIQQTSDGGYIVAGYTGYTSASIGTDYDAWVLKLTLTGEIEWQKSYGRAGVGLIESAKSIWQTYDGGYIVAGYTYSSESDNDFWVLKLFSNGDIEWEKTYGGPYSEIALSIQQTDDGGYIVTGSASSFSPGEGDSDLWILKLSPNGDIEWQKTAADSSYATSVQQTSDGGYIVGGYSWVMKLFPSGEIEWVKTYTEVEAYCPVQQTSDGGYIVAGYTESFGVDVRDFCVLKLTPSGDIEWQKAYGRPISYLYGTSGEPSDNRAKSICQTSDGGYIVVGYSYIFREGADILTLKLSSNGDIEWARIYGEYRDEYVSSVQQTYDGGYVIAGESYSFNPVGGGCDLLVLKLGPDGEIDEPCEFIIGSTATFTGTSAFSDSMALMTADTDIVPLEMDTVPRDTDAIVIQCDSIYSLTISATDGGATSPSPPSGYDYYYYSGTEVQIEALPDADYKFSGWTGDIPLGHENDNPITIVMDCSKDITANFTFLYPTYTLTIAAGTGGITNPIPGTYTHDDGDQVSITAIQSSGYVFSGWSGDASGTTNPINITMDDNKSVKANFSQIPGDGGDGDEDGKGGGCFIATAAYGSPLHPHVETLRNFRDKYLMPNDLGREFVDLYYKYSPYFADLIVKHKALKVVVQINLLPLVVFSYSMLHFGSIVTAVLFVFIFMFPIFLILLSQGEIESSRRQRSL